MIFGSHFEVILKFSLVEPGNSLRPVVDDAPEVAGVQESVK